LTSHAAQKPNIVFFLVDDLGWTGLTCYGSRLHETPNIDALAASGVRFTHAYAASPVCSPTRASIVTGRHPVRVNITDWIPGSHANIPDVKFKQIEDRADLALNETTFAESFKTHGYQTFFVGKWHLGSHETNPTTLPTDQGFDVNVAGFHAGSPAGGYYSPWDNPFLKNPDQEEYLTERLTKESISLIEKRAPDKPFLLYFCYYNVHSPVTAHKKKIDYYKAKAARLFKGDTPVIAEEGFDSSTRGRQDDPELATMVSAVDDSVGEVMKTLKQQNLLENTIVVFFSDNGGLSTFSTNHFGPTSNYPLRAGKGWLYEGGIREPLIINAPQLQAGKVIDARVVSMDLFPTLLDLTHLPLEPEAHVDGKSLLPLLQGKSEQLHDALYFYYPHYHGSNWKPGAAIIVGEWKLIHFYHYSQVKLYNLNHDPSEAKDLSNNFPEKTAELSQKLDAWLDNMHAQKLQTMTAAEMEAHRLEIESKQKKSLLKKKTP